MSDTDNQKDNKLFRLQKMMKLVDDEEEKTSSSIFELELNKSNKEFK